MKNQYADLPDWQGGKTELRCAICGDSERDNLVVELVGISAGMSGEEYSFCRKCWESPSLGIDLMKLIGRPYPLKLNDEIVKGGAV